MDTKQIEAARVAITRFMKRRGKVWIRIFPDKSFTKKPLEVRMGTGKGGVESWVGDRRKWKRLLIRSPAPGSTCEPCEATKRGHGGCRRPATRPPETNGPKSPGQSGLMSPHVARRTAERESPP
jgi:hypothetical protein